MKKVFIFVLVAIMTISVCSVAFATVIKSGTTSGGTAGTTTCSGELHYNLAGAGQDYVYAVTATTGAVGNIGATAKIYYNSTSTSATKVLTSSEVTTGKATVGTGYRATSGKTSHNFYSSAYGSWSATITKGF